jgi:hypothetical protein
MIIQEEGTESTLVGQHLQAMVLVFDHGQDGRAGPPVRTHGSLRHAVTRLLAAKGAIMAVVAIDDGNDEPAPIEAGGVRRIELPAYGFLTAVVRRIYIGEV